MAKTVKMNGVDVTSYFTPRGMKVAYAKVLGSNGGTMLNGDLIEDVLAWKAKVTLDCMPLTEAQMTDFLTKATATHPTLYYFDPRKNAYRTIHYMANVAEAAYKGAGGTGTDYWTGYVLTAEETCEFAITQQPANATVAAGEYANYSIQATGEDLTYQWQYSSDGGTSWTNSTATSGKTPNYRFNASASQNGRSIRCLVSNGYETLTSQTATLTVTT